MIPYIIKVALILAGCLAFYKVLLGRETFYKVNRFTLVICLFISFALPLVKVPQQWSFRKSETINVVSEPAITLNKNGQSNFSPSTKLPSPEVGKKADSPGTNSEISFSTMMSWLIYLYWFGVIVFGISFLLQLAILIWKAYHNPVIVDGQYRIIEISGDKAPCSFANNIFINPAKYEWDIYNQILLHEKVHIRQKHTLDILAAELVLVFQWFNPFAWVYRRTIENNLEFLTDDQLMERKEIEKSSYQLSLLKVSVPHLPLSLTTNYNQSILKKRIAMMNTKKSNLHTAWKYFFLLPILALFACLLNEPSAKSQTNDKEKSKSEKKENKENNGMETEGSWFATIKGNELSIQFKDDKDEHSFNSSTFKLDQFTSLPRGNAGTFKLTRDAGTMEFTGKFDNNTGMGNYKFIADQAYKTAINGDISDKLDDRDVMVFFFVDMKKGYPQMLKAQGFKEFGKEDLIPLAALNVDEPLIKSVKENGFKDASLENLVTLKALNIDGKYIDEIRGTGLKNVSLDQLITFKAQGIDKEYINKVRKARGSSGKEEDDADNIVTFKSLNIDENFVNSFKEVGYTDLSNEDLVSMKGVGVTPEFIRGFQAVGYKKIRVEDLISLKALEITPEFIKGFESIGYKEIPVEDLAGLKATGVTAAYVKSMKEKGFNYDKLTKYITLKSIQ